MVKTHFAVKPPMDATAVSACGRGARLSENPFSVNCGLCARQDSLILALDEARSKRHEAFMAQTPREVREPWRDLPMVCSSCGDVLFRHGERTCMGHYQNFHCANCGHVESRLTETGRSF